jgi:hypothetical protein
MFASKQNQTKTTTTTVVSSRLLNEILLNFFPGKCLFFKEQNIY